MRRIVVALSVVVGLLASAVTAPASEASSEPVGEVEGRLSLAYKCVNRDFVRAQRFLKCLDKNDVLVHEAAFAEIARANGGNRAAGSSGYDQSVEYVAGLLEGAGLTPIRQEFEFSVDGERLTTENLIVEIPGRNRDNVVMAGAHLDSVAAGPGVQDNGSGSGALLAIALEMARNQKYTPQNTLRFAWWGAEEVGLIGSLEYFVNPEFGILDTAEMDRIAAYLNFDMVASPNHYFGVYDADGTTFTSQAILPPGSQQIEDVFEAFYSERNIAYDDTDISGLSDHQWFLRAGIPAGGLFTGADGIKTAEQAALWGGRSGRAFDPCYHTICDTSMGKAALKVNIDAIAYAIFHLAASTESVNGVVGVEVVGRTPADVRLDGPQGTFARVGGADHDHRHDDHPDGGAG